MSNSDFIKKKSEQTERQHEDFGVHPIDYSLFEALSSNAFFSWVSNQTLISSPFPPIYDPLSPELRSTRWHGTISGIWENNREKDASDEINQSAMMIIPTKLTGFFFMADPTARTAFGFPTISASCLYETVFPSPTSFNRVHSTCALKESVK